jgi:tRNA threonylcarbamoyladenosine biosynthesis protein TsaE
MDLWRLPEGKAAQLIDLERVFGDCVSLVEWPDRLGEALPAEHLAVYLAIMGQESNDRSAVDATVELEELEDQPRVATLTAVGTSWESRLRSNFLVGWPLSEVDR